MTPKIKLLAAAVIAFSLAGLVNAQEAETNPSPEPLNFWGAVPNQPGQFRLQPVISQYFTRGQYDNGGTLQSLGEKDHYRSLGLDLYGTYGISENFDMSFLLSTVHNSAKLGSESASMTRLGDSALYARYLFVKEGSRMPALSFSATLRIPTGKYEEANADGLGTDITGSGAWGVGGGLLAKKSIGKFNFYGDAGIYQPFHTKVDGVPTEYGTTFHYDLSAEYVLPLHLNLFLEMNGGLQGKTKEHGDSVDQTDSNYLDLVPGIGWTKGNTSLVAGYIRSLSGKNDNAYDGLELSAIFKF